MEWGGWVLEQHYSTNSTNDINGNNKDRSKIERTERMEEVNYEWSAMERLWE